jgi:hypothetical protein
MQVTVFWVVTSCNEVVEHQLFGGSCYLHLKGEVVGAREITGTKQKLIFLPHVVVITRYADVLMYLLIQEKALSSGTRWGDISCMEGTPGEENPRTSPVVI